MSVARTCIQSKNQALKTSDKWSATSICICCLHSGDLCCFKYPFQFISLLSCVSFLSSLKNWMLGSSSPIKGGILCINKKQLCQTRASQLTLPAFSEASSLSYLMFSFRILVFQILWDGGWNCGRLVTYWGETVAPSCRTIFLHLAEMAVWSEKLAICYANLVWF